MKAFFIGISLFLSGLAAQAQQLPIIHLEDLSQWTDSDQDTLYVLNFWATWCRPCVAEMPHFEAITKEYADQPVKVVFISLDFKEDLDKRIIPFLEKKKLVSQVVLLDETNYNKWIDTISPEWSGAIPATLFVNHSRNLRKFHEGDYTEESLSQEVKSLLTDN